jgi:hypothetical protein
LTLKLIKICSKSEESLCKVEEWVLLKH